MSLSKSEINSQGKRYLSDTTNTNVTRITTNENDILAIQDLLEEDAVTGTFSNGDGTSASIDILISRYSRIVVMTIPAFQSTITAGNGPFYTFSVNMQATFRPSENVWGSASTIDGASNLQGHCLVLTTGEVRVYRNADHTTNYNAGVATGSAAIGFSYALL